MKALILAAGYATRLYPLTKDYPKPLLEVNRRPIIDYIVDKLTQIEEIDEIVVVTNSKFVSLFKKWSRELKTNRRIVLVDDRTKGLSDRLGAIGDMNFAIDKAKIASDLLVIGGDNLFGEGLEEFMSFAKKQKPSPVIGVYDIRHKPQARKYGVVALNRQNRIIDFQEKPKSPKSTMVAMCLYYFPRGKLKLIKEYLVSQSNGHDATGFYINWLRRKVEVYGFIFKDKWYDIGDHKFYKEAESKFF